MEKENNRKISSPAANASREELEKQKLERAPEAADEGDAQKGDKKRGPAGTARAAASPAAAGPPDRATVACPLPESLQAPRAGARACLHRSASPPRQSPLVVVSRNSFCV